LKEVVTPLEGGKKSSVIDDTWLVCVEKKFFIFQNNDHGVDVNMIIVI
jgi:hypothetical protein